MTRADLDETVEEAWFDPSGFLLVHRKGELLGFCWTKLHDDPWGTVGEIYVIGVDPAASGLGLGRLLLRTGLANMAERGIAQAMLYVEADNEAAQSPLRRRGLRARVARRPLQLRGGLGTRTDADRSTDAEGDGRREAATTSWRRAERSGERPARRPSMPPTTRATTALMTTEPTTAAVPPPISQGISGKKAPRAKVQERDQGGSDRRADAVGSMPSSSRAWVSRATSGLRIIVDASSSASSCSMPLRPVDPDQLLALVVGLVLERLRSTSSSRSKSSRWACIERYSPEAIEKAPATSPAMPARRTTPVAGFAPAKPRISETLVTRPSLMPKTAARWVPPLTSRCSSRVPLWRRAHNPSVPGTHWRPCGWKTRTDGHTKRWMNPLAPPMLQGAVLFSYLNAALALLALLAGGTGLPLVMLLGGCRRLRHRQRAQLGLPALPGGGPRLPGRSSCSSCWSRFVFADLAQPLFSRLPRRAPPAPDEPLVPADLLPLSSQGQPRPRYAQARDRPPEPAALDRGEDPRSCGRCSTRSRRATSWSTD